MLSNAIFAFGSRMLAFTSSGFSFPIHHRKSVYDLTSRFFSRFEWLFVGFELLGIGLMASRLYLYGDGLDCVMEGIQNKQDAEDVFYREWLGGYCALYGHPPKLCSNETSKNETFIQSLDYFISSQKENDEIKGGLVLAVVCCFIHLCVFFLMFIEFFLPSKLTRPLKKIAGEQAYQFFQVIGITMTITWVIFPIFLRVIFLAPFEEDFKYFKFKGCDSPFQLLLKFYRYMWPKIMGTCFLIFVVKFIEVIEGFIERWHNLRAQENLREESENSRWYWIFEKLRRISKAIEPKEEAIGTKDPIGTKEAIESKEANDASKQKVEKKVIRKLSLSQSLLHSFLFNNILFSFTYFTFWSEFFLVYQLAFKEVILPNRVDCILKGIENEAQANSEPYRELVRNTCGMFGVPPNYMPISYENHSLFMRMPALYVGKNLENSTNGTFRINYENETFGGRPDYTSIRREEELHRKPLVLALVSLVLVQILMVKKFFSYHRHLFFPYFKLMVAQIIYLILILLILVLCKSLTFGQTSLFSPNRTVFQSEQQTLPVLWNDLPKIEGESQASLLSYLLSTPKLDFQHFVQLNNTKELPLRESLAHQPHSDNKIYHSSYLQFIAFFDLPWNTYQSAYLLLSLTGIAISVACIAVKTIQIVHLLIQGKLFAYKPWNPPSSEERWKSLFIKLDEICDTIDKRDQEREEKEIKERRDFSNCFRGRN